MRFDTVKRIVLSKPKGTFSHLLWEKQLPVRKSFAGVTVVKRTMGTVRLGVTYDNMKSVKDKRDDGRLPEDNAGLAWGRWKAFPYFIEHNGKDYLRVALDKNNKLKSEYFINGIIATKEQAQAFCLASAFRDSENMPDILTISIENILAIR